MKAAGIGELDQVRKDVVAGVVTITYLFGQIWSRPRGEQCRFDPARSSSL